MLSSDMTDSEGKRWLNPASVESVKREGERNGGSEREREVDKVEKDRETEEVRGREIGREGERGKENRKRNGGGEREREGWIK